MTPPARPPSSLVLAHGAGSGPWVFDGWSEDLPGLELIAVDLQWGLDVGRASMADYAERVLAASAAAPAPAALCGWSMGGLAVLMAAERARPHSVILLEASAPAEVQGHLPVAEPAQGSFDPEAVYGAFPPGLAARPESLRARAERKRGISVPSLPCPSLVLYGDEFAQERGAALARLYGSQERHLAGLDHWGLVRERRVRPAIAAFLGTATAAAPPGPGLAAAHRH